MKFFLFLLFLFLLFGSLQGSTFPHKRCTRGLNTTLQTNFNGVYQRINPCTNAEIETSSYVASNEFCHHTKENNWTDYSHKCSSIISSFLQAIGNLVRFNNKQNGTFNFHINTSISQKQDRCDLSKQKSCVSMPTVIIEATDCEISPRSCCKSSSDETENKGKVVSFCGTFTNNPNQLTFTTEAADQNRKYEETVTGQPEEIVYYDDYPTTIIPSQETTPQYQAQPPMQAEERWQQDENSWTETQPTITDYSPAVFTDISQQNTDEPTFETSNPNESEFDLATPYVSTQYNSLTSDTNSSPNPFVYYSTPGTDFEGKSRREQSIPDNQRSDFVSLTEQTLTTELPPHLNSTQLPRPIKTTPSSEEYQPAEFEAIRKTPPSFNYRPEVSTSFPPATVEYDELSGQNSATEEDDFYTEVGKPSEGQMHYSMDFDALTTQNPPFENTPNYPGRFSIFDQTTPNDQSTLENLSPVTLPNPNLDSNERSTMSYNPQIFQPINAPKHQSLVKSNFPESPETQLFSPLKPFTNEVIPEYSVQYPNDEENQMTDSASVKPQTQNNFTQPQQRPVNVPSRQFSQTFSLEQQPIEDLKVSPPRPPSSQTNEEETTTTDYQTIVELERQPLRDFTVGDRETGQRPVYVRQQSPNFLQLDSQIRGNTIAPGFRPTFFPQGPRENLGISQPRSPSAEDGMTPIQFSTISIPEYVNDRESKKSEPAVNTLKQYQPQPPFGELYQRSSVEQQGNSEISQSRYETYEDEFQTAAGPTHRPSLQLGIMGNIAQTLEQEETSSQPEPQFITESPGKSNKNSEHRVISIETTPNQFQATHIPEYTDAEQGFDVTTISPQILNTFDQSKSQLKGNATFYPFLQTYSSEVEGIKIPQSQPTEVKTNNKNEFQTTTKTPIQFLNNDNQFEKDRKTQTPNSVNLNRETSNTFVRSELQPQTSTSEQPKVYFEILQPGHTTSKISEEKAETTDFQTTREPEYQLPHKYNRERNGDRMEVLVSPFLNSRASGLDEPKPPMAPDYGNSRQFYQNFTPEQNRRKNSEMQPLEMRREEPNFDYGQYRPEETVTTDYQTTAEPEHQTTRESTVNDRETEKFNSGYRQQQISNAFGLSESQFRGYPPFQQPQVYEPDNVTPLTGRTSLSSVADASEFITGNHYATSFDDSPTENRNEFQTSEMNFNHNRQDDYTTPPPFYDSKPTLNERKPPQEVKHSVATSEERPTAFKEESFADSAPTSAGPESGLSGALPSPIFVPRYPGQVLNENATTPNSNAPALYSEQTTPKISSLRWRSPAESHTFGSPADPTGYNYRDPAFSGPSDIPVRPFDTFRTSYYPNGRPQFEKMNPVRSNHPVLPGRPNLPYYPEYPDNSDAPDNYRSPSRNPEIRQPMDESDFRNVRPVYNDRFPIPPGRYRERTGFPGMRFFQTSDPNRRYLNDFPPENQMPQEDDNSQGERPLPNPEIASPQFEQQYERTQSERFSDIRSDPPNFHPNERFLTDEGRDFQNPDQLKHQKMLEHFPPSSESNSHQEFDLIRRFPARPEPADFRTGSYNRQPGPSQEIQYYPDQQMNHSKNRFYPVSSLRDISTFPEQNHQENPIAPLQRHEVNNQQYSKSFSTASSSSESQTKTFPLSDLSNSTDSAQNSIPPRHQYPTEAPSSQAVSESPETQFVSYIQTRAPSELESQFLTSTLDNDQSISNEFQPKYNSESQTETTLSYSNDRPVASTEQRISDVAIRNGGLINNGIRQNRSNQAPPIQQEFRAPFSSETNNNFNHFPSTVPPKFTTIIYDETITTTDFPALPPKSTAQPLLDINSRDLVENKQKLLIEDNNHRALTLKANLPSNLEKNPVAFVEVTPIPIQPNFQSQQAQDNTPMNLLSNADKPQPQPSLDYVTDISGYETTENNAQIFGNSSPQQLEPWLNRFPYSQNAFPKEFHENQDNKGMAFPTRDYEQDFGAPIADKLDDQSSLQSPMTVAMTPTDPLRKPQPIPDTAELMENASPQTLFTAAVKYDKKIQSTDLSSTAPRLQPQMAFEYSNPISEDNSANTSPDRQHLVTSPPPDFTFTLPMNYEKISDKSIFSSLAESQVMNGQTLPQYATPPTHQTQSVEYYSEEIANDSPKTTTPTPISSGQNLSPDRFNAPQESQSVAADRTFQREIAPGQFDLASPNFPIPEARIPTYDRQITNTQAMSREDESFIGYNEQLQQPPQMPQKQLQMYIEDKTTPFTLPVNQFMPLTDSKTNERVLASTPSTFSRNLSPLVTPIPSFAPEEHPSSGTTKVVEEILTTDLPMTDYTVDSQLAYATKLLNTENKELEVLQKDAATPNAEKFESPAESLSYSDQLSSFNVKKRSEEPQFFDGKSSSQFFEENNEQQVQSPISVNPGYVSKRREQENPMLDHDRNASPQSGLKRYDESTPDFNSRNMMDKQLFDSRKTKQPDADFPLEAGYRNSQQAMTYQPMMFTSDNETPKYPPLMSDEPHSNPLLHTLQSHLALPLHSHPQATVYSQTDSGDPHNSFAPVPPYPGRQEFERNSVPSQGPPQPDSVVSGLNTPSNMPDLPATGRFGYMSRPLMNPWERSSGRGVSAPERF